MQDQGRELGRQIDRRGFLGSGAGAIAAAAALGSAHPAAAQQDATKATQSAPLPKRKLGKTGVEVTMLNIGTWQQSRASTACSGLSYANGVRYFDTAKVYGSEPGFGQVVPEQCPRSARRSSWSPRTTRARPSELIGKLDQRLAALETDYIDLFFIHGLGDHDFDDRGRVAQEQGIQGDGRGDPQVGQGASSSASRPTTHDRAADHPGGGRGRVRRRDHAPVHPLARQGRRAEQGARRLPQGGDRPDLDEAGRRQLDEPPRRSSGGCPMLDREEADALPGAACTRSGPTSGSQRSASR